MLGRDDRGSVSLTAALLAPLVVVLLFAAVQAALWSHARTEARIAAKNVASLVARHEIGIGDARETALANLDLDGATVAVERRGDVVVVTVRGRAPGILLGTSRDVTVVEALPVEELTTP